MVNAQPEQIGSALFSFHSMTTAPALTGHTALEPTRVIFRVRGGASSWTVNAAEEVATGMLWIMIRSLLRVQVHFQPWL